MASDLRWSRRLSLALFALAGGLLCGLVAWAAEFTLAAIIGLGLSGALLALDLALHLHDVAPASVQPAAVGPPSVGPASRPVNRVLTLRRGEQCFIFSAPPGREIELELAIAQAACDGWLDYYEAAALTAQIPGALPT